MPRIRIVAEKYAALIYNVLLQVQTLQMACLKQQLIKIAQNLYNHEPGSARVTFCSKLRMTKK